ncbi:MAG TPA: hypothetical protein VJ735_18660 [Actinomycetes bacterium]|nr:hypothetical protein [Actinomycetes bacterium]
MRAVAFMVSQGIYGQRAFRRDLEASPVAFPGPTRQRAGPLTGGGLVAG